MACMARSGFLTLRDCGMPEARNCGKCSRPMCMAHLSPRSGFTDCLECAATTEGTEPWDPEWSYGYRRRYYGDYGYSPFYFGGQTFDDYDVRSFHAAANRGAALDEEANDNASFGDS